MNKDKNIKNWQDDLRDYFKNKNILILGLGLEGNSALNYFIKNIKEYSKNTKIYLIDKFKSKEDIKKKLIQLEKEESLISNIHILDNNYYDEIMEGNSEIFDLNNLDIILKSPGVKINSKISKKFENKIFSQIEIFLKYFPGLSIGVTGTKGKSTTVSLMHYILSECGYSSKLLGNIGFPVFDKIDDIKASDIAVIELSSFALEYINSPTNIAAITNIFQAHIDYHENLKEYIKAKLKIFKNIDSQKEENLKVKSYKKYLGEKTENFNKGNYTNEYILLNENISIPKSKLLGKHNEKNIKLVKEILLDMKEIYNLKNLNEENIDSAIKTFTGLKHRLEIFYKDKDSRYINDSIATVPESTINAVNSVDDLETLILGGDDDKLDTESLIEYINNLSKNNFKNIILLPDSGKRIKEKFNKKYNIYLAKDVKEAANIAFKIHKKGTILLSPAARSYGYYKNFEDRGNQFKKEVLEILKNINKD